MIFQLIIMAIKGAIKRKTTVPENIKTADEVIDILEYGWLGKRGYFSCLDFVNRLKLEGEEAKKFDNSFMLQVLVHDPWYEDYLPGKQ